MSQRILSGFAAAVVLSTLAVPAISQADVTDASIASAELEADADPPSPNLAVYPEELSEGTSRSPGSDAEAVARLSAVKVGERQLTADPELEEVVAQIQAHPLGEQQAATLYVRNIPVITFLGDALSLNSATLDNQSKLASSESDPAAASSAKPSILATAIASSASPATDTMATPTDDPVWQASELAAQINQLYRDGVDPATIQVQWREGDRYVIQVGEQDLVTFGDAVILPDTTRDPAQDALQAANRLRRLLGGAEPLSQISGMPERRSTFVVTALRQISGMASWYGPGFNGNRSASGEIFDQNALTAAHRTLPFGTLVRVTNVATGQNVVVRINDRGPYSHGRVIDLSAGAARAIGLIQMGVAPVEIDVVNASASVN